MLIGQTAYDAVRAVAAGVMKVNTEANFQAILPPAQQPDCAHRGTGQAFAIPKGITGDQREAVWALSSDDIDRRPGSPVSRPPWPTMNPSTPYHPTISGNIGSTSEAWNTIFKGIQRAV